MAKTEPKDRTKMCKNANSASFSVVLVVLDGERWIDIGRFDTAHGCPHEALEWRNKIHWSHIPGETAPI